VLVRGLLSVLTKVRALRSILLFGVLAALGTRASADPDPAVRDLVERAQRHFDLGEYDDAIAGYRAAYRADPRPALIYNLAQAYRLEGDCVTATVLYRNFVRLAPDSDYRPMAEQHLTEIAECSKQRVEAGVQPVPHAERDRTFAQPAPPPETTPPSGLRRRHAGLVTAGSGLVALAMGAYFSWDATRAAREVSDGYRDGASWSELAEIDARGQRAEVVGGVLIAAGAAAAVTGAVLYAAGWHTDHVALQPRGDGAEMVVSWRY
jgi:tetratricopeptide (TPR) repeat protein